MDGVDPSSAVADDEALWRRVHSTQLVPDGSGAKRVSSAAFKDPEMSVDRRLIREACGQGVVDSLGSSAALAEVSAGACVARGQECRPDPLVENPSHALVVGKKTKPTAQALAAAAQLVA